MKHLTTFGDFINESKFTDYSNNELAAYVKNNPKDKEAAQELHKRSQKIKALTRTDESEDFIFEGDVNYKSDKFALVSKGGSIGSKPKYPVFTGGKMASIIETSNDKEALKEKAKRMAKSLSPGERKYYGMGYSVIEITPSKVKEIEHLIDFRKSSENDKA
jgi:hypothetical protein